MTMPCYKMTNLAGVREYRFEHDGLIGGVIEVSEEKLKPEDYARIAQEAIDQAKKDGLPIKEKPQKKK